MKIKWADWQLEQWPGAAVSFPIEALVHAESANKFTKMSKQPKRRLEKWKPLVRVRLHEKDLKKQQKDLLQRKNCT
jgi:hypothetical protein